MEAIRTLIRGDLSPAGFPILTKSSSFIEGLFDHNYTTHWLDSGTSALALALINCRLQQPHLSNPQVIIPGYCCPDLVAAAIYAGVEPLVVDIGKHDPGYDLEHLENAIGERVIAVIAVNFLGVKENLDAIRNIITDRDIKLIEDNAQWFPGSSQQHFSSDYVVFSFGRGKPLSLLTGGVLLSKKDLLHNVEKNDIQISALMYQLKIRAYNLLLHPNAYYFLNRLPFIHLGETHLHLHQQINPMFPVARKLLAANMQSYYSRDEKRADIYQAWFATEIQNMTGINTNRRGRLLRYPLLLKDQSLRDSIYAQLHSCGLGVSLMYQQELNNINGVAGKITLHSPLVNARSFAQRLLTLPLHAYVDDKSLERIKSIIFDANKS